MPYEAVADDEHVVCLSELDKLVCKLEVPYIFSRMDLLVLHAVLCNDRVEVCLYEVNSCSVDASDFCLVEGCSDIELAFEGVFYSFGLFCL